MLLYAGKEGGECFADPEMDRSYHQKVTVAAFSPGVVGIYTVREAGRLAHIPHATVERWTEMGLGATPHRRETGRAALVTFDDLISLFTVRELRRANVPIDEIKRAEETLSRMWSVEKPFAFGRIRTGYQAIVTVLREGERAVAVGAGIQEILTELVERDLLDVTFDATERAREWKAAEYVLIAPTRQLGQPCVQGTRVTTRTVYQFISGGETFEELSDDLDIPPEKLQAAYDFEESLAKRNT